MKKSSKLTAAELAAERRRTEELLNKLKATTSNSQISEYLQSENVKIGSIDRIKPASKTSMKDLVKHYASKPLGPIEKSNDPLGKESAAHVSAGSGLAAVAARRQISGSGISQPRKLLHPSQADVWGKDEVKNWLSTLGLDVLLPVFEQNNISGQTLLDLTSADLDYMNITALGDRKLILRGVDQLKAAVKSKQGDKLETTASVGGDSKPESSKVHWSHLEPLSGASSTEKGDVAGASFASSVRGDFDEAGERAAFQDALRAWRASQHPDGSEKMANTRSVERSVNSGSWENPFDSSAFVDDDSAFLPEGVTIPTAQNGKGIDYLGEYNEEKERMAFREALMAWRGVEDERVARKVSVSEASASTPSVASRPQNWLVCYNCMKSVLIDLAIPALPGSSALETALCASKIAVERYFCSEGCRDVFAATAAGVRAVSKPSPPQKHDTPAPPQPPPSATLTEVVADPQEHLIALDPELLDSIASDAAKAAAEIAVSSLAAIEPNTITNEDLSNTQLAATKPAVVDFRKFDFKKAF